MSGVSSHYAWKWNDVLQMAEFILKGNLKELSVGFWYESGEPVLVRSLLFIEKGDCGSTFLELRTL